MKSERVVNWWCGFEWCILNTENYGVQISSKKWNPFVIDEFPDPDTLKEIVRFVHEVHPVFAVTLSTFLHMLCEIMIPCQLSTFSEFIWNAFQFEGLIAKNNQ